MGGKIFTFQIVSGIRIKVPVVTSLHDLARTVVAVEAEALAQGEEPEDMVEAVVVVVTVVWAHLL